MAETVDTCEMVESPEPLLANCVEVDALLGGRFGVEAFLVGNGGGAFRGGRAGLLETLTRALPLTVFELAFVPSGSLNGFWLTEEPYVTIGGLLAVFGLVGRGGLSELGIGGGGGRLATIKALLGGAESPACCCFNAAMRCARVVNWGSSTSAMMCDMIVVTFQTLGESESICSGQENRRNTC